MRKLILSLLMPIALISCKEVAQKDAKSASEIPSNSEIRSKADIDFMSNPMAEDHRDVISEKYNALEVNFASYYVITTWGCGSGCVTGAMVDTRDGKVYSMPEDKEWGGNGTYIESKKESEILLTVAVAQSPTGETEESRKYWVWNEDLKTFTFMKAESVLSGKTRKTN